MNEELEKLFLELFFASGKAQKTIYDVICAINCSVNDCEDFNNLEKTLDKILDTFCSRCRGTNWTPKKECWACKYEPRIKV